MTRDTRRRALHTAAIAVPVILADQLSKYWLLYMVGMVDRAPMEITGFFRLVMVWNQGVSFGMLKHPSQYMPYFLILVAVVISTVLARLAVKSPWRLERVGYGMVIGGALANVIDRVRYGAVADFFYFHLGTLGWPAFNVADAFICIGVALLLWMMMRHPQKP